VFRLNRALKSHIVISIYIKEAQKCFCGTEKCRGTIGINKSTPLKSKKKTTEQEEEKKTSEELFQDEDVRILISYLLSL
jgi:hypothetical protein